MLAVIQTGGKQYIVSPGEKLKIEKLGKNPGEKVTFDKVLLFEDEKENFLLGTPYLEDVTVEGEVIEEGLGEKKRVFKYKPKKRYRVKKGHRQPYTQVEIKEIKKGKEKSTAKTKATPKETKKETKSTKKEPVKKTAKK